MVETVTREAAQRRRLRIRHDWARRLAIELGTLFVVLLALAVIGLLVLDTAPGHRFIVDRLAQIETASGLRFRIGRIEGSIFGETRLKNVAVLDQRGAFLTSPEIDVDWTPGAWLRNKLYLERVEADRLTLHRLPKLRKTGRRGPILPKFDIHIGDLKINRLELAPAVSGVARTGALQGTADVRAGRAVVGLREQ